MKAKLSERFKRFVGTLPGFEDIDSLTSGMALGMKRADYFVCNRDVIIEQKALTADPGHKVQKYADKVLGVEKITTDSRFSLYPALDEISDGVNHHKRLLYKLSKILEDNVSDADKQLRDTREIFSIQAALGVVVMLNEAAIALDPHLTGVRVENLLAEKAESGRARFPNTDLVVTISDIHTLSAALPYRRMGFHVSPTSEKREAAFSFAEYLKGQWIGFTGETYVGLVRPPSSEMAVKLYGGG